jgi:PAS domain S-box-containing protein
MSDEIAILQSPAHGKLYDYALPILDYDDKVVGRVRIGFENAVLQQLVMDHLASTGLLLAAASLVVFLVIVAFIRYDLVGPIQRLCAMAERLAAGQFDTRAPELKTKELATLGTTLSEMAYSLRERDAELSSNYQELEETNLELQKSYESLESISSELGRSREMYRSLLDDASDAILVCDEGDTIVIANKAAESFFGLAKARMEKSNYFSFLEMINCRDVERQFEHHQTLVPGQSAETEIRFWRAMDNCNLVGKASASVIIDKDKRRLVQIIVRDVTQEEEVRQNLERTASEMERLNQMKNSFMGLASHELKTPLTIIMGYVELLLSEREPPLDEDTIKLIHHIAKASDRLSEIVRDIVDVSMIDGRTVDLVSRYVDINVLVMRAANNFEQYINQREQTLNLNLAEDLPLIKCDFERIVQAIGNVLNNAIKFTPDKGRIIVETKLVLRPRVPEKFASVGADGLCTLSSEQIPYVEIAIYDSGIGIDEEEQEAIFEKFYEVGEVEEHSTGKVAFKSRGAGLGLSIVKGIVDLHGGAVWVESPGYDPDAMPGSTFYLLLPATSAAA